MYLDLMTMECSYDHTLHEQIKPLLKVMRHILIERRYVVTISAYCSIEIIEIHQMKKRAPMDKDNSVVISTMWRSLAGGMIFIVFFKLDNKGMFHVIIFF